MSRPAAQVADLPLIPASKVQLAVSDNVSVEGNHGLCRPAVGPSMSTTPSTMPSAACNSSRAAGQARCRSPAGRTRAAASARFPRFAPGGNGVIERRNRADPTLLGCLVLIGLFDAGEEGARMWSRTSTAAAVALVVVTAAGCAGVSVGGGEVSPTVGATPTASSAPGVTVAGPFVLPASACDLVTPEAVAKVADRGTVTLTHAGVTPTGSTSAALTCAFTAGLVPVGLLTVDVHPATSGRTPAQELDDSVAGSLYRSSTTEDVPGLGAAAKYGSAFTVDHLSYATVWAVALGDGQVGDLTVTVASDAPANARAGLVDLARTALARLQPQGGAATASRTG